MVPSRNAFKQLQYKHHNPALAFPARTQLQQAQHIRQLFPGSRAPLFALPSQMPGEKAPHLGFALSSRRFPGALTGKGTGVLVLWGHPHTGGRDGDPSEVTCPSPGRALRTPAARVVFVYPAPRPAAREGHKPV